MKSSSLILLNQFPLDRRRFATFDDSPSLVKGADVGLFRNSIRTQRWEIYSTNHFAFKNSDRGITA